MSEGSSKYLRDLSLLLIGFILTTIIGGALQERSWEKQHTEDLIHSERESAEKVFSEISSSMDDMLYRIKDLVECYKRNNKKEIEKKWAVYDEGRLLWGKSVNKYFALLSRYYGNDTSNYYRKKIYGYFTYLDYRLRILKSNSLDTKKEAADIDGDLVSLSGIIYDFDVRLLNSLKSARVGQFLK